MNPVLSMSTFRFRSLRAGLPAILLLAAACGDAGDAIEAAPEAAEAERGGTLVVGQLSDIGTTSPLYYSTVVESDIQNILYRQLLRPDWRDGSLEYLTVDENPMALARRYEFVGDSTAIRFHLASDARWSDGTPITASDVKLTYELLGDPEVGSTRSDLVEHIDSVTIQNDSTLTFHYDQRYATMLGDATHQILPAHVYADVPRGELATHPSFVGRTERNVVSGPFQIAAWEKGQRLVLEPNPYFPVQPNLDRIVMRVIPDPTARLVEFQTGNVDWAAGLSFEQVKTALAQSQAARVEHLANRNYEYIAWNPEGFAGFANPAVRRALGLAIDAEGIRKALNMEEFTSPAGGPYPPIFEELYDPQLMSPVGYDPERARELLEAAGWRDADGDGIREKEGQELSFTLLTNAGNQRRADVAQIVQQQLRAVGADMRIQTLEFNTVFQRMLDRDYDAVLGGWTVDLTGDLGSLWGEDSPYNIVGYRNPEFSRLVAQGRQQPTPGAAADYWKRAAVELVEDHPTTYLYFYHLPHVLSERARGVDIDPFSAFQNPWEWWIPQRLQRSGEPAAADTAAEAAA